MGPTRPVVVAGEAEESRGSTQGLAALPFVARDNWIHKSTWSALFALLLLTTILIGYRLRPLHDF